MLKSGKSSSSVALQFWISETAVRNIKKKWAELDRYEITFGSRCSSERKSLKRPSTDNEKKSKFSKQIFVEKFGEKEIGVLLYYAEK